MIILSGSLSNLIDNKTGHHSLLSLIGISFVSTIILYAIFKFSKNKEGFHFEVTPEKQCDGGSYMHQSNEMCQKMWSTPEGRRDLANYNCLTGYCGDQEGLYNGRPLNMGYRQDISNGQWKNELCKGNFLEEDAPMVL